MCRLYGFRATESTKVECTLVYAQNALLLQSRRDQRGKSHPDGWGIAFYENGEPHVERRTRAAFEDLSFSQTAARVNARTVVAHVRQATVSVPILENTHPFVHGRWAFAHNGTLTGFEEVFSRLESETDPDLRPGRRGSTDSEAVFYWLLTRMAEGGVSVRGDAIEEGRLVDVVRQSILRLAELSSRTGPAEPATLNLLLATGDVLVATRWGRTLYYVRREAVQDCEICGIPHTSAPTSHYRAVVVASEPITSEPWREVPEGALVCVGRDLRPTLHAIASDDV